MIEPIMYFGIGFLVAALIGLVIVPLVHNRAVRLTMRRLEAATPLSMAEIQADKDQLRAEFAMSTRRLEMSVEQLKTKSTSQLAELGKKGDAINRLKLELGEKTAAIFALEARDKALREQLRATEEEIAVKATTMHEAQRALSDKEADLARLVGDLDERSTLADTQKVEIVALRTQVDALKERLDGASRELRTVEDRRDTERVELKAATQELQDERGKVENLGGGSPSSNSTSRRKARKPKSSGAVRRTSKHALANSRVCSIRANSSSSTCGRRLMRLTSLKLSCARQSSRWKGAPVRLHKT